MKSNEDLQKDVQNAIKWEPLLHAAEIGVTTKDGIVSLTGVVDSYAKKLEAENAAGSVGGVKAVVENIEIKFSSSSHKSDEEIAMEALNALKGRWDVPNDNIQVKVEDGWITLHGELPWNYQKEAAHDAIMNLIGVKGISNSILIKSETKEEIETKDIEHALERNWSINSQNIDVNASGTTVTLSGKVSSWYQKDEAGRIAWSTPGVCNVVNELLVEYDYLFAD
jgi:osmotically-inducible protein OsmY